MGFKIVAKDKKTRARAGILQTRSGKAETPFFMPVATKTAVKQISSEDLNSMKARAIISNAFVLSLRPGTKVIKKAGGIGKFMNFQGTVFTDSGGFQMYSPALYISSEENGVIFRNPFSGEKLFITPEADMQIQLDLGADVAMCFDSMPLISHSKNAIADAVKKTGRWAVRCKKYHDFSQQKMKKGRKQLLFGICQGGVHSDLREKSAKQIAEIDFDGFAIGGLALGEGKADEYKMIDVAKKFFPENKPVYLMGAGDPIELLEAVSRGVDMFDSRFPTKNARHGALFTSKGRIILKNAGFSSDFGPIDSDCVCFVCKRYSRAYLCHLLRMEEAVGLRLASYHNLFFLQDLMKRAREEIRRGKFKEFFEEFKRKYEIRNTI